MEAATPLHQLSIRTVGERVLVDGLVVDDPGAVALVRERDEAGEDPAGLLLDAIAIGARVLAREQAGANAEFVKSEFEKVSREVEVAFADRARGVSEALARQVDEAFGPESGHLTKALQRHFSDESAGAVQHRVKAVVDEVMARSRDDLLRQFSAADGRNPLADFKSGALQMIRQAGDRQDANLRALLDKLAALERDLQGLRDERAKHVEVEAERERGTAKGRTFEEHVSDALDALACAQGDGCEAVGDVKGATRKTGDVVVAVEGARGAAQGRIVFEAKTGRLSRPKAVEELDRARAERDADFAVLVVPTEEQSPAGLRPLREYNGDKLIVCFDPDDGSTLALEVAYALARARVLLRRGDADGVDTGKLAELVERAAGALDDARKVKLSLTGARTSIETARELLEAMERRVREHLTAIGAALADAA